MFLFLSSSTTYLKFYLPIKVLLVDKKVIFFNKIDNLLTRYIKINFI